MDFFLRKATSRVKESRYDIKGIFVSTRILVTHIMNAVVYVVSVFVKGRRKYRSLPGNTDCISTAAAKEYKE